MNRKKGQPKQNSPKIFFSKLFAVTVFLLLVFALLLFTGCSSPDNFTGSTTVEVNEPKETFKNKENTSSEASPGTLGRGGGLADVLITKWGK